MNTKLIDSLVQIVESLSPEEQNLLEEKLKAHTTKHNPQEEYQKLVQLREQIFARRGGKPLNPPPEEIIQQMREERDEQFMRASFPELYS